MPDIRQRLERGDDEDLLLQQIVETLEERAPHLLQTFTVSRVQATKWSGPLPRPDVLAEFEKIVPGAAARIIAMTEHVLTASGKTLDKVADAEISGSKRGQWMAYSLAIFSFVAGVVFFAIDKPWAGTAFISLPVVLLITSFLSGGDPTIFRNVFGKNDDDDES